MQEQFDKFASFFPVITEMRGTSGQLPLPLAMAYIPPQKWTIVYDNEEALRAGTLCPLKEDGTNDQSRAVAQDPGG